MFWTFVLLSLAERSSVHALKVKKFDFQNELKKWDRVGFGSLNFSISNFQHEIELFISANCTSYLFPRSGNNLYI